MIAIVGATGTLGGEIARRLLAANRPVIAITRTPARAAPLASLGAVVRAADLTDRASLDAALRDATAVCAAAHALLGRGKSRSSLVDDLGHRALIDAAAARGVDRFVYTSVLGAMPQHPAPFWRIKSEIEEYLQASGLRSVILRPAAFMELHAHELIGKAVLKGGTVSILGRGERPLNFVSVRDVATFALMALTRSDIVDTTIEIGGPDNVSRNDVAALYARESGRPLRIRHLPIGVVRVLSTVMAPIHPGVSELLHASVVFETIDQSFDPTETLSRYPMTLTSLETFVRERAAEAPRANREERRRS